jgi:hypothetical protein
MPLPIAAAIPPIAVWALRAGLAGAAIWAARRAMAPAPGRTDQRAEDALDDLPEGMAAHAPADRDGQRNAALRWRRVIGWKDAAVEVDLAAVARLRVRRLRTGRGQDASGGDI